MTPKQKAIAGLALWAGGSLGWIPVVRYARKRGCPIFGATKPGPASSLECGTYQYGPGLVVLIGIGFLVAAGLAKR